MVLKVINEVYKHSGMSNVEYYVQMSEKRDNSLKQIKSTYESYKISLGDEKFHRLLANLMVKNSKPVVDSLHLIKAFPSTKRKN